VSPVPPFQTAIFSERFKASYAKLSAARQKGCDEAVIALIKGAESSGLRIKPILPAKLYLEARIASGDRLVFRREGGQIVFLDVVTHDEIARWGR